MSEVTIGCDPEFFLFDTETRKHISAHGMVPGTKAEPHKLNKGAVQLDGMAVEFNIDPAETAEEFNDNIETVVRQIRKMIPERYKFSFTPAVVFDKKYFDSLPDYTKVLGCEPDYSASTMKVVERNPEKYPGLRTCSGHVHVGWGKDIDPNDPVHMSDCAFLANRFSGNYYYVKRKIDKDTERSRLYGFGAPFRPKPYGVELREPSNAWLKAKRNRINMFKFVVSVDRVIRNVHSLDDYNNISYVSWVSDSISTDFTY